MLFSAYINIKTTKTTVLIVTDACKTYNVRSIIYQCFIYQLIVSVRVLVGNKHKVDTWRKYNEGTIYDLWFNERKSTMDDETLWG